MRISDWSSDVCSSDLPPNDTLLSGAGQAGARASALAGLEARVGLVDDVDPALATDHAAIPMAGLGRLQRIHDLHDTNLSRAPPAGNRSEEHTSELQSLMRISYAVFCLKKKKEQTNQT